MATIKKTSTKKTTPKRTTKAATRVKEPKKEVILEEVTSAEINDTPKASPKRISKNIILPLLGLLIFAALVWLAARYLVIAWVDKKPITRIEYYQNLESRYGKDIKEQMIVEKLILDEAQNRGVSVSDQEVDTEINKFVAQQGGQEQLNQILQMQGLNMDQLKRLVRLQLLRQKMFGANIQVSDDELNKYITENKDALVATPGVEPTLTEQEKQQIKEQLKQQKVNEAFQAWLDQALQSSRVQRN
jgi:parvulin-like peptidyl-prolyl isomerase